MTSGTSGGARARLGLMGGGLGLGAYGALQLKTALGYRDAYTDNTFSLGLAIAYLAAGVVLEGVGTCLLISRLHERAEIDRELEALNAEPEPSRMPPPPPPPAAKLPSAPVFFSCAWEI